MKVKAGKIEILLLVASVVWVLTSYFFPYGKDAALWFARSGSVMVLFAIIVEFRLASKLYAKLHNSIGAASQGIANTPDLPKINIITAMFAHIFVVIGTVIWGYGDCLISCT